MICEPPPSPRCEPGSIALAADAACRPSGSSCPPAGEAFLTESDLRALAPAFQGAVRYVAVDAGPTGDGSRAAPFPTLAAALRVAASGDVVALGVGTHRGGVELAGHVALVGSCVARTAVVAPSASEVTPTLSASGAGEQLLTNFTVRGERPGIRLSKESGVATLRDLRVEGAPSAALWADGASTEVELERVHVVDARPFASGGGGTGLLVRRDAHVVARGLVVEGAPSAGVFVMDGGSRLELFDGRIADVEPAPGESAAAGIFVLDGAGLTAERLSVRNVAGVGVYVSALPLEAGVVPSAAILRDVSVSEVREWASDGGVGLVLEGAEATLERLVLRGGPVAAILAFSGAKLHGTELAVVSRRPAVGGGITLSDGVRAELARLLVVGAAGASFSVADALDAAAGSVVTLEDAVVFDGVWPADASKPGAGVDVFDGASLSAKRVAVIGGASVALSVAGDEGARAISRVVVEDLVVLGVVRAPVDDGLLSSVRIDRASELVLRRARLEGSAGDGIVAIGERALRATLDVEDLTIHDLRADAASGKGGAGVAVYDNVLATLTRVEIERVQGKGITSGSSLEGGSVSLTLTDATIRDVTAVSGNASGVGPGLVSLGGSLRATRVLVERATGVGLYVSDEGATLNARDLTIRSTRGRERLDAPLRPGFGLGVGAGVTVSLARVLLEANQTTALSIAGPGTLVVAEDLDVSDTASDEASGEFGDGIVLMEAALELNRCRVISARDVGLLVAPGGEASPVLELLIEETSEAACAPDCPIRAGGAVAIRGGSLDVERFSLRRSALYGVNVAEGGRLRASHGRISSSPIGVNVSPSATVDLAESFDDVESIDNEIDVETTELPIPTPPMPGELSPDAR